MSPENQRPALSIVIPVFNGEGTIGRLTEQLLFELKDRYPLEIILVNDDSTDGSEEVCLRLHERFPRHVKFLCLAKNVGEHNAVMAGLNYARGDHAVIMDDDGQNPVSEVPRLVEAAVQGGYDAVYASYDRKYHPLWRNVGSWFNDQVANILLGKPRGVYLSSFKALNRFLIQEIIKYDLPFPYIDGLILRTTSRIGQVKVAHATGGRNRSGYSLWKLVALWSNLFVNFSILPLRVCLLIGAVLVVMGSGVGIQLVALGLIGEYVGRMSLGLNKTPQYAIRRSYPDEGPGN